MRQKIVRIFLLLTQLGAASASAAAVAENPSATGIDARLLLYRVSEPGAEPYISRLITTDAFLRLDQGAGDSGFILLDRAARVIYSVNPDDQLVLLFRTAPTDREPAAPSGLTLQQQPLADAPRVAGVVPQQWQIRLADQLCASGVVVPGLMPEARAAWRDYLRLLAAQQQASLAAIPPEFQQPCDQLLNVQRPGLLLERGLPLRQWEPTGRRQELLDFRPHFPIDNGLFTLPAGFRQIEMGAR